MWMWSCMRNVNFSFLINGSPRGKVLASRGLRQRDPISPLLFLLIVDVLNRLVSKSVVGKIFHPFKVGKEIATFPPSICWWYYFPLLWKWNVTRLNCDEEKLWRWGDLMSCEVGCFPSSYLGLPLGSSTKSISFWNPVVDKVKKRVASWKNAFLQIW